MPDVIEEIATLIAEVGRCYRRGRRYRDIAARCEEHYLAGALEIGSSIRRRDRSGRLDAGAAARAADGLRNLLAGCEAAIAAVHASDLYRRTVAAWEGGYWADVAAAAPSIFASVEPYPDCPTLYYSIAITSRRAGGDHFISPSACADAVNELHRSGIAPPSTAPELGADERIQAVLLSQEFEVTESPIALAIEPSALDVPRCRIGPAGDAVIYTARLCAPFRVRFAEAVADEWWALQPDAYDDYTDRLTLELTARGLPIQDGRRSPVARGVRRG
jgi:hypothetical protein